MRAIVDRLAAELLHWLDCLEQYELGLAVAIQRAIGRG